MQPSTSAEQGAFTGATSARTAASSLVSSGRLSKGLFVLAAGVSFLFSVYLWFLVDREQGLFVGLWVPSILALGALLLSGKRSAR